MSDIKECRCAKCNKLLCKVMPIEGAIRTDQVVKFEFNKPLTSYYVEAKCTRCGTVNTFNQII